MIGEYREREVDGVGNIEKHSKIKAEQLSQEFYFQSLLQEAHVKDAISDGELEAVQMQCLKLMAENTERYNKGRSSSIRVETAQAIMASNFYTIGLYLKSRTDPASALEELKREPIAWLYEQGLHVTKQKLRVARYLYLAVVKTRIQTPNYSYNETINNGIKIFFQQYNPDFEAHETPAFIDYQLAVPVTGWAGVEYMIYYLHHLHMENQFCARFDSTVIHRIMQGYHISYQDLLINIFEQVLQNALGRLVLDKDILTLNLSPSDIGELKTALHNKSQESIYSLFQWAADMILEFLALTDQSFKSYVYATLPDMAARIHSAAINGTLQTIFVPAAPAS